MIESTGSFGMKRKIVKIHLKGTCLAISVLAIMLQSRYLAVGNVEKSSKVHEVYANQRSDHFLFCGPDFFSRYVGTANKMDVFRRGYGSRESREEEDYRGYLY